MNEVMDQSINPVSVSPPLKYRMMVKYEVSGKGPGSHHSPVTERVGEVTAVIAEK